ncbi:hypothetical protein Tco_0437621, partial [Tanacetum coccineum]
QLGHPLSKASSSFVKGNLVSMGVMAALTFTSANFFEYLSYILVLRYEDAFLILLDL